MFQLRERELKKEMMCDNSAVLPKVILVPSTITGIKINEDDHVILLIVLLCLSDSFQ